MVVWSLIGSVRFLCERRARYWIDVPEPTSKKTSETRRATPCSTAYDQSPQELASRPAIALVAERVGFAAPS